MDNQQRSTLSRGERSSTKALPACTCQAAGKWEASLVEEDIVSSCWKQQAGVSYTGLRVATQLDRRKGVICQIWEDEDMPVNAWGTRAELIVAPLSTVNRMNIGRPIEHEVNGSMEMLTEALRDGMGYTAHQVVDPAIEDAVNKVRQEMVDRKIGTPSGQKAQTKYTDAIAGNAENGFNVLRSFYETTSPRMNALFSAPGYKGTPKKHLESVLKDGIYLWAPIDSEKLWVSYDYDESEFDRAGYEEAMEDYKTRSANGEDVLKPSQEAFGARPVVTNGVVGDLERLFPARRSPVWYRGCSGNERITQDDVLIAPMYMFLLEKTAADWSGVASARHQHYGLPAKLSKQDKHSKPASENPVRMFGEAEVRLTTTVTTDDVVADVLEMSNSPGAHKNVVENIYRAEQPTNIEEVLDRSKVAPGSSRSQVFVAHTLQCAGLEFFYVDHTDEDEIYPADAGGVLEDLGITEEETETETDAEDGETETKEDAEDETEDQGD